MAQSITVDYSPSNTIEDVHLGFAVRYRERYDTLRLLSETRFCQSSGTCPSWVPDPKQPLVCLDPSMESATSHFVRAEYEYRGNGVLGVLGRRGLEISAIHSLDDIIAQQSSNDWYYRLVSTVKRRVQSLELEVLVERCSRVLCSHLNELRLDLVELQRYREEVKYYVRSLLQQGNDQSNSPLNHPMPPADVLSEPAARALDDCIRFLQQARLPFIFSHEGHIGVRPMISIGGSIAGSTADRYHRRSSFRDVEGSV